MDSLPLESPATPLRRRRGLLTIPNMLTFGRLASIPFFVAATFAGLYDLAFTLFVAAGVTDMIDGYVARRLNQRSSIGAVLDPAADKIMMFSAYIIYTIVPSIRHRLPGWLTLTIFMRDVLIVFFAYLLYTRIRIRKFPPSAAGKTSTVIQIVTLSATIGANTVYMSWISIPLLTIALPLTLVTALYSGFDYLRRAQSMLEESGARS